MQQGYIFYLIKDPADFYLCRLMKIFAFFMAVLVLTLSVMPCADINAMSKSNWQTEIKAAHQNSDNHIDICSPFCQCSCCAGFSINHSVAAIVSVSILPHTQTGFFPPSEIIKVSLPVWQPPQLLL